jgi:putative peptide zinc metalloprotease protein
VSETATPSAVVADTATPAEYGGQESGQAGDEVDGISYREGEGVRGVKNVVRLVNKQDARLRIKGNIELNRISSGTAQPSNIAFAYASCTDCDTLSVALQIDLVSRSANVVSPENAAIALNYQCTRCYTRAWALQYVISVDDPRVVPDDVSRLIKAMDREMNDIRADKSITVEQAIGRIEAVVAEFKSHADDLRVQTSDRTDTTTPGATEQP